MEGTDEEGDLDRQNVMLVTLNGDLSDEEKANFEAWIDTRYDQNYTFTYLTK